MCVCVCVRVSVCVCVCARMCEGGGGRCASASASRLTELDALKNVSPDLHEWLGDHKLQVLLRAGRSDEKVRFEARGGMVQTHHSVRHRSLCGDGKVK